MKVSSMLVISVTIKGPKWLFVIILKQNIKLKNSVTDDIPARWAGHVSGVPTI